MTGMVSGADLKAERLEAGVRAQALAILLDRDPADVTRLEQAAEVDDRVVRRYRRGLSALRAQRATVRRELVRELLKL